MLEHTSGWRLITLSIFVRYSFKESYRKNWVLRRYFRAEWFYTKAERGDTEDEWIIHTGILESRAIDVVRRNVISVHKPTLRRCNFLTRTQTDTLFLKLLTLVVMFRNVSSEAANPSRLCHKCMCCSNSSANPKSPRRVGSPWSSEDVQVQPTISS